jgi:Leucine-rich repeat (LRR) protein
VLLFVLPEAKTIAQVNDALTKEELEKYKKQVTELVKYFEETLNFLGDPVSVAKEKEIVVNDSYLKMFVNDKVQIEDDLDENRNVPLHKDVRAYLKDIGFFFRKAKFEFVISEINHYLTGDNLNYFKVSLNRILDAVTVTGDTVHSRQARFIEVNLNIPANTLKIASVYTTKLDEREESRVWWNNLSLAWRDILGKGVFVFDTIEMSRISYFEDSLISIISEMKFSEPNHDSTGNFKFEIPDQRDIFPERQKITDTLKMDAGEIFAHTAVILKLQKLDVTGNNAIRDLGPLSELTELREIRCSNTLITSLVPIRNLNHLEILDFSETPVDDFSPMHYSATIRELNCGYTLISDLSPLAGFHNLETLKCDGLKLTDLNFVTELFNLKTLSCGGTRIYDLSALKNLKNLSGLDISGTGVFSLDSIAGLTSLTYLNCENTSVSSIVPVSGLRNLGILRISNTPVKSLEPLRDIEPLRKIYCDHTGVARDEAIRFMRDHPSCLVMFESDDLIAGWRELENGWKKILRKYATISEFPTQEELHTLLTIKKMDISGNQEITTVNPLKWFFNLTSLDASSTKVIDFTPVSQVIELEDLNISGNNIAHIDFLSNLSRLHVVNLENTYVSSLRPLENKHSLRIIYADNSQIKDEAAFTFRSLNRETTVIFKTKELESWWDNLPAAWKAFFTDLVDSDNKPSKEQLHRIIFQDSLSIRNNSGISDLSPITMIRALKKLALTGTSVSNLYPLAQMRDIEEILCNQSPVSDLSALSGLPKLKILNVENTPLTDLEPITGLSQLESLNCSGTQIKSLSPVESLYNLKEIKINNTSIKSLKSLLKLPGLMKLECFNTGISSKSVDKFKALKPGCTVVYY